MRKDPLLRLRAICLALPEATEKQAWGYPTFRVRDRLFAMYMHDHHGDGRIALWCNAPPGDQELLIRTDPDLYFVPPYVGPRGWVGVHLNKVRDWSLVADLVREGYRLVAPKRLVRLLDERA
jgi:hypothetical protein